MIYRSGDAIVPLAASTANERSPALSRDGAFAAYVSDASGRDEVYVKRVGEPLDAAARQVSRGGGVEPVWAPDGLLYRAGDRMMLDGQPLFEARFVRDPGENAAAFDVDLRSRTLVMLKSARSVHAVQVIRHPAFAH